jgi:hypothetical protein
VSNKGREDNDWNHFIFAPTPAPPIFPNCLLFYPEVPDKRKFCPCAQLIKHHFIKTYGGSGGYHS